MKRNISGTKGTARKKTRGNNSLPVENIKKVKLGETNTEISNNLVEEQENQEETILESTPNSSIEKRKFQKKNGSQLTSNNLSSALNDLQSASENLSSALNDLPPTLNDLPPTSDNLPSALNGLSPNSDNLPSALNGLSPNSDNLPPISSNLSSTLNGLQSASENLPSTSNNLIDEPEVPEIDFSENSQEMNEWVTNDTKTILAYKFKFVPKGYKKLAAFDLDGTIITTKSKKKFAQDIDDWKILNPKIKTKIENLSKKDYIFLIFSNQLGVKYNRVTVPKIKQKFMNIVHHLNIPCVAFLSIDSDKNRKPSNGMLDFFQNEMNNNTKLDLNESFFVGDAMGRPQDHSAADILFAVNSKMKFIPIESFLNEFEKPKFYNQNNMSKLKIPKFNPFKFITEDLTLKISLKESELEYSQINNFLNELKDNKNVLVFLCGLHGSGKTFFYEKYLKNTFTMINKSKNEDKQNIEYFKTLIQDKSDKKLVLDQPNSTISSRKSWLNLAKEHNLKSICIYFDVNEYLCLHNIRFRNLFCDPNETAFKPWEVFKQKTSLVLPEYFEGFDKIFITNFYPNFENNYLKEKYMMYLYEKE